MGILNYLFGKKESSAQNNESDIGQHIDLLNSFRKPALLFSASSEKPFSKLGGLPDMPSTLIWPEWKGKPLAFLCQIDLQEIPNAFRQPGLPAGGMLYFFYNQKQNTWGFDPNDRGSWKVLYTSFTANQCTERQRPAGLKDECIYSTKRIAFSLMQTYPDWQDERVDSLNLTDKQLDEYTDLCQSTSQGMPSHRLLGYPSPVQGNYMDLEAQLVSNGLYCGDASGYNDARAKALESGRNDWLMLLQLDSDDDTGMMWGDLGMLYFWIRKDDLAELNFENCWMILQCS